MRRTFSPCCARAASGHAAAAPPSSVMNSRLFIRSPRRRGRAAAAARGEEFAERTLRNIDSGSASVRLDVEGPDEFAPLLRVVGDEPAEVGRRTLKDRCAQGGKSRLDL